MKFLLGCNYWASNAGIEMWRQFNPDAIKNDLKILSQHGIEYLRVFPLWRDFQPVTPNYGAQGYVFEYVMEGGSLPQNDCFLDEEMLDRFSEFLDICDSYNMKLIIGLVTGWMSGGLFVPPALYSKNLLTDPLALYFEQLFIKGFVGRFKDRQAIFAWDLGNECNCMADVNDAFSAASWTATISNAIHAADPVRPVVSGMHGLTLDGKWKIQDQARFTDILTTHPYPLFCRHTAIDETLSLRTTMHATAETKWYADIGSKPCFAEEIGTLGPMICSNEKAADFLRLNLFSLWANGVVGLMWWCNHDQHMLNTFPYTVCAIERELGLINANNEGKPTLFEMKKFADFLADHDIALPKAQENGVCLLTKEQDHWGSAYMTYILAKTVGLNLKFSYAFEQELPPSNLYFLPSLEGFSIIHSKTFETLKQKVFDGADLYISAGQVFLSDFESLVGLKVIDSCVCTETGTADIEGKTVSVSRPVSRKYVTTTARVIAADNNGNPFVTVNKFGKGNVFFVDVPIESNLLKAHHGFNDETEAIYQTIFKKHIAALPLNLNAKDVVFTLHPGADATYLVAINHSETKKELNLDLKGNYEIADVLYGDRQTIKPYDSCVFKLKAL